jgi:hypothetical protein
VTLAGAYAPNERSPITASSGSSVTSTTVMNADDVGMPERRSEISFPVESGPEFLVGRPLPREQFQGVTSR